jgi:hypothetical protein
MEAMKMRRMIALLLLAAAAGLVTEPAAQPPAAAPAATVRAEELTGVWTGQWLAANRSRGGAVEMILAIDSSSRTLVAQVTFIDGSLSDTVRREGRLTRQGAFFDLVGGGAMVLTLEPDRRLTGEFAGGPDLPARQGLLELTRKS